MTEETRKTPAQVGDGFASERSAAGTDESIAAPTTGAERDMREILASIRKLMKETPTPERGAVPEARRREERARRFQTVEAPPRAPVDDWPDDPEIDVDVLAEELLSLAGSLAAKRSAALSKKAQASRVEPAATAAVDAPQGEPWRELDALLSYAEQAFDAGLLEDEADAIAAASRTAAAPGPSSAEDLVAYPTSARGELAGAMPDLSDVLDRAGSPEEALRQASSSTVPQPLAPSATEASPMPSASGDDSRQPPLVAPAAEPEAEEPAISQSVDAGPALVPAPPRSEPPVPEQERRAPTGSAPDGSAPTDRVLGAEPTAAADSAVPQDATSARVPAPAPAPAPAPPAGRIPDDPRNAPSARSAGVLATIGEMVRAKAEENLKLGQSTYSGRDPHPRIVEKTGWSRGRPARGASDEGAGDIEPPLSPTELALKALDAEEPTDAVDGGGAAKAPGPGSAAAGVGADATQALRPMLADWLDQNLARLMEDLVKERMSRLGDNGSTGDR